MMLIDTHAHLYLEQFREDIDDVILRAQDNGVQKIFLPNIDSKTIESLHGLCNKYPDVCFPLIGLHPCSVKEDYLKELEIVKDQLNRHKYYGIGETGIDLYWDKTFVDEQIDSFRQQIHFAKAKKLPVIIHSRDSLDLTIEIIEENKDENLTGVFHCFNGTLEQYARVKACGFLIGLGGVITFKNANLAELVKSVDLEDVILETDAPYLSPVPFRGKRNESSYLRYIAEFISETRGDELETIIKTTTEAAKSLYQLES